MEEEDNRVGNFFISGPRRAFFSVFLFFYLSFFPHPLPLSPLFIAQMQLLAARVFWQVTSARLSCYFYWRCRACTRGVPANTRPRRNAYSLDMYMYAYIYVCVRGEGEEKRIQNVAMLIYLSKSLYGIFIKYIYIFILELYFHE